MQLDSTVAITYMAYNVWFEVKAIMSGALFGYRIFTIPVADSNSYPCIALSVPALPLGSMNILIYVPARKLITVGGNVSDCAIWGCVTSVSDANGVAALPCTVTLSVSVKVLSESDIGTFNCG